MIVSKIKWRQKNKLLRWTNLDHKIFYRAWHQRLFHCKQVTFVLLVLFRHTLAVVRGSYPVFSTSEVLVVAEQLALVSFDLRLFYTIKSHKPLAMQDSVDLIPTPWRNSVKSCHLFQICRRRPFFLLWFVWFFVSFAF